MMHTTASLARSARLRAYHVSYFARSITYSIQRQDHRLQHPSHVPIGSPSHFHTSSPCKSDFFHGLSLNEKIAAEKEDDAISTNKSGEIVQEAQVVKTEEDKRKTRDLIAELVRAEMMSYSSPKSNTRDVDSHENAEQVLSQYEKQMHQLQEALERHSHLSDDSLTYSVSCRNVGEMHYRMGHMEQAQEILIGGLQSLMKGIADDEEDEARLIKGQMMHLLGAVMARCGEFEDALSWYEESLKLKRELLSTSQNSSNTSRYHYEIGKTFNGMAALEVMSGGENAHWEKATTLFRDAERNYLHDYRQFIDLNNPHGWDDISQEMVAQMNPYLVQLVINVRSNMGELLRQQKRHLDAAEMFQLALELAQMDVRRMNLDNEAGGESKAYSNEFDSISSDPSPEERRNAVVDLLVKVADCHVAYENYDEAAAAFEQALAAHVAFRRLTGNESSELSEKLLETLDTKVSSIKTTDFPLNLASATTVEAAIRNNLAYALTRISQPRLALEQYEISLQIKRQIGGDNHIEVGRTLMEMGVLLGGPMNDLMTALNCFKEALYIYKYQRDVILEASSTRDGNSRQSFYDADLELDEINEHMHNASKNISMIEDALLQNKGGVGKPRRP